MGECLGKLLLVSDAPEDGGLIIMGSRYCLGLDKFSGLSSCSLWLLDGGGVVEDLPDLGA